MFDYVLAKETSTFKNMQDIREVKRLMNEFHKLGVPQQYWFRNEQINQFKSDEFGSTI